MNHRRRSPIRLIHLCLLLTGLALLLLAVMLQGKPRAPVRMATLPMAFEPNLGQIQGDFDFIARTRGGNVFLTSSGAVFAPQGSKPAAAEPIFRMKLVGAKTAVARGVQELPGKANYFIGNDRSKWRSEIPTYSRVQLASIYPGIDVVYYGNDGQLEFDFVLRPGADPGAIRLAFEGTDGLHVDEAGDLVLRVAGREVRHRRPRMYQQLGGEQREVLGGYTVTAPDQIAFRVDNYDRSAGMVIDPVLTFSAYVGGAAADDGHAIGLDGAGNIYFTGATYSANFPVVNARQSTNAGNFDAFVVKLNPSGSSVLYSTYLGGNGIDIARGIAVDSAGNAYVVGYTASGNFPTLNAYQATRPGLHDGFVTKLNPSGSTLLYSTYLGGSQEDYVYAVAIDGSGSAYVAGSTNSPNFIPMGTPGFQGTYAGAYDGFVTKLNPNGSTLAYSTYFGGTLQDEVTAIAVDVSGAAYITGDTASQAPSFPVLNAFQPTRSGTIDAFVAKLNPSGTTLSFSTFIGGSGADFGYAVAIDGSGNAYVAGQTESPDFPVSPTAMQPMNGGGSDAFAAKVTTLGALVYSTFLGGSARDIAYAVAVDGSGNAFVAGETASPNFPVMGALQRQAGGLDAFVTKINAAGTMSAYSTFIGGTGDDSARGIALDGSGNAYVTGQTDSADFPTLGALGTTYGTHGDVFVMEIGGSNAVALSSLSPSTGPTAGGTAIALRGGNFAAGATVAIGGSAATNVTVTSSGTISATTAAHAAGPADVVVRNPDATSSTLSNGFTYADPPPDGGTGNGGGGKSGCGASGAPPGLLLAVVALFRKLRRRRT